MATSQNSFHSDVIINESRLLTRSLLSDPSHSYGSSTAPTVTWSEMWEGGRRYVTDLFLQRPAFDGSAAALSTLPSSYDFLRTTIEAIARWYRAIVPRDDCIPLSERPDYTL